MSVYVLMCIYTHISAVLAIYIRTLFKFTAEQQYFLKKLDHYNVQQIL